ncbi:MAG: DNA-3-methyladenine glycosylase 2 family protein [Ruminococcus sp.]|nr:DNA-3-methyladenine glycosylase 2 family protein [Ruminococcus sp.]
MYFQYGKQETEYLKSKDVRLGAVIEQIGHIDRAVDTDLFSSVVHHIIGQQISTKAQRTIWKRMNDAFGEVTPASIGRASIEELQALGMTFRKAEYINDFAEKVMNGEFDLNAVENMSDTDAIAALAALKGIGVWTAEMILLFCFQRPDILSFDDLAIQRGMRMVYHHRKIDRKLFEKYRRRLSPCCSVASLYFWAVAGGAIPEMRDYAPRKK